MLYGIFFSRMLHLRTENDWIWTSIHFNTDWEFSFIAQSIKLNESDIYIQIVCILLWCMTDIWARTKYLLLWFIFDSTVVYKSLFLNPSGQIVIAFHVNVVIFSRSDLINLRVIHSFRLWKQPKCARTSTQTNNWLRELVLGGPFHHKIVFPDGRLIVYFQYLETAIAAPTTTAPATAFKSKWWQ